MVFPQHVSHTGRLRPRPGSHTHKPEVVILGHRKCGTNALAELLARLGLHKHALNGWTYKDSMRRQGFWGEVNWPCNATRWNGEAYLQYKNYFAYEHAFDKSTAYDSPECAHAMLGSPLANSSSTHFLLMLCDPIVGAWSELNHLRSSEGGSHLECTSQELDKGMSKLLAYADAGRHSDMRFCTSSPACERQWCKHVVAWKRMSSTYRAYRLAFPSRFHALLTERSKAMPVAFGAEVGRALGRRPAVLNSSVHTHAGTPSALTEPADLHNKPWAIHLARYLAPELMDLRQQLLRHETVDIEQWWPSTFQNVQQVSQGGTKITF